MRCTVGAVGVAVVQIVINGVGSGFAFLGSAVVTAGQVRCWLWSGFMERGGDGRGGKG